MVAQDTLRLIGRLVDEGVDFVVIGGVAAVAPLPDLAARPIELDVGGRRVKVSSLEDLIAMKAALGRPKDKLVEVELRAILERQRGARKKHHWPRPGVLCWRRCLTGLRRQSRGGVELFGHADRGDLDSESEKPREEAIR